MEWKSVCKCCLETPQIGFRGRPKELHDAIGVAVEYGLVGISVRGDMLALTQLGLMLLEDSDHRFMVAVDGVLQGRSTPPIGSVGIDATLQQKRHGMGMALGRR